MQEKWGLEKSTLPDFQEGCASARLRCGTKSRPRGEMHLLNTKVTKIIFFHAEAQVRGGMPHPPMPTPRPNGTSIDYGAERRNQRLAYRAMPEFWRQCEWKAWRFIPSARSSCSTRPSRHPVGPASPDARATSLLTRLRCGTEFWLWGEMHLLNKGHKERKDYISRRSAGARRDAAPPNAHAAPQWRINRLRCGTKSRLRGEMHLLNTKVTKDTKLIYHAETRRESRHETVPVSWQGRHSLARARARRARSCARREMGGATSTLPATGGARFRATAVRRSLRQIALELGKSPSTIKREMLKRRERSEKTGKFVTATRARNAGSATSTGCAPDARGRHW